MPIDECRKTLLKFILQLKLDNLFLSPRAVMTAAAGNHNSLDGSFADETGLALAAVNTVLELKESFFAVGIHVIRNRRPAQCDRFL